MSSSSSFNVIRRHASNAADIRLKELTQELAKQRSELTGTQLETDDVRSQGRMDHSTIKVNDERLKFVTTLASSNTNFFYEFPSEPDFNYLKVWFMLDHLGARMRDMSGLGNDAYINGHPTLRRSGLDMGFQQTAAGGGLSATPVMLFNSGTDVVSQRNGEYIFVLDNPSIQFSTFSVGFSITFRFNCLDFNNHDAGEFGTFLRRFAAKTDDALNGWNLVVYPTNANGTTGGVEMNIVDNGTTYQKRTTGYNVNTYYQVVVTYDRNASAGLRIKIYTGGVETSLAGISSLALATQTNLRIGARSPETGFFYGYLHDFRMYMGKVLTQAEVTNINANEMSIDNIIKGRIFVIQYAQVSQSICSKTHKFHMGGILIRRRIHKFNVTKKLTLTHTHRFIMVKGVSRTRTHKFTMVGLAQRNKTHKYGVGGTVRITRTHKFNLTGTPILTQVIRFQKNASGTAGATQEITLNFTPKVIQVLSVGSIPDNSVIANYQYSHGFSDGTNHACMVQASRDGVATSDTSRSHRTDSVVARLDDISNNTITSRASVTFGTNKITFTWDVNDTYALWITVLALGGGGIQNAKVNTVSVARSTTGVQNYTGLGFTPVQDQSVLFTLSGQNDININAVTDHANSAIGCAVSTTKRWAMSIASNHAQATSQTFRRQHNNLVIAETNATNETVLYSADFNGWITDGFALNWTAAPPATNYQLSYMVIKGGMWDCGNLTTPTAITNNVDTAVSVSGRTPKALLLASTAHATSTINTIASVALFGVGVTDGTTQASISGIDEDGSLSMDNYKSQNQVNIMRLIANDGVVGEVATFDSFSANNFRLDWTTKSTFAQIVGWVVVADPPSSTPTQVTQTKTHKYNVGDDTPSIIDRSPAPGATDVSIFANIVITFSEDIDPSTVGGAWFELRKTSSMQTVLSASETRTPANNMVTVNPSFNLQSATNYTFTVKGSPNGVKDLAGNQLSSDVTWTFTTA